MKVNLNQEVKVELTEAGARMYRWYFRRLGIMPPKLESQVIKLQLWELMNIFGEYLYNGATEQPIKDNIFEIKEDQNE